MTRDFFGLVSDWVRRPEAHESAPSGGSSEVRVGSRLLLWQVEIVGSAPCAVRSWGAKVRSPSQQPQCILERVLLRRRSRAAVGKKFLNPRVFSHGQASFYCLHFPMLGTGEVGEDVDELFRLIQDLRHPDRLTGVLLDAQRSSSAKRPSALCLTVDPSYSQW